jgi:hypothetical protein
MGIGGTKQGREEGIDRTIGSQYILFIYKNITSNQIIL